MKRSAFVPACLPAFLLASACLASDVGAHGPASATVTPTPYMPVTSTWRGATLFGKGQPVTVRFVRSIADWGNELALMDPATGGARPLFSFHRDMNAFACPDSGFLYTDLGVRDSGQELVFRMRTVVATYAGKYCTGEACGPRYSGMNAPWSRFHSSGEYAHMLGTIWAEMARVPQAVADSLPAPCTGAPRTPPGEGGVLVSFNDGANDTYGDLIFLVTGVEMDVERTPRPVEPPVAPPLPKPPASCRVEASAGGVAQGEAFVPRPMALPLSAIRPRASGRDSRFFIDQAWRQLYPGRPDETAFPNGPEIKVTSPGPFRFDLGFFTNSGEFVNRARGEVTSDMLRMAATLPDGRRQVSLMWYPVSARGVRVSTGAYIVKGRLESLPDTAAAAAHTGTACGPVRADVLSTLGYLRR